jgi:hypothetical protein
MLLHAVTHYKKASTLTTAASGREVFVALRRLLCVQLQYSA